MVPATAAVGGVVVTFAVAVAFVSVAACAAAVYVTVNVAIIIIICNILQRINRTSYKFDGILINSH